MDSESRREKMMLPTPSTAHLTFEAIYEPAEDSYLLLDTLSLKSETTFLRERLSTSSAPLVVEVGTGSGIVLSFLTTNATHIFGRSDILTVGTDVNKYATAGASRTIEANLSGEAENGTFLSCIVTDLVSALRPNQVDVLVFNPPYVPTPEIPNLPTLETTYESAFEEESHMHTLAYAGGLDGMVVTDRLLNELDGILSENGLLYLLLCASNRPEHVVARLKGGHYGSDGENPGKTWNVEMIGCSGRKAGWEKLSIWRIWK